MGWVLQRWVLVCGHFPSRDSDGGTAWLLHTSGGSVLVDVPLLSDEHLSWMQQQPPGWIVLTHRQGHGRRRRLQNSWGPVLVQEQEAYRCPRCSSAQFWRADELESGLRLWTPGPTPGSCCLHWAQGAGMCCSADVCSAAEL